MTDAERNELLIRLETAQMTYAPYLKNIRVTEAYEKEKAQFEQTLDELENQKVEFTTLLGKEAWESFLSNLTDNERDNIDIIEKRIENLKKERKEVVSQDFQKPALDLVNDLELLDDKIKALDTEIRSKNKTLRSNYKKSLSENNYVTRSGFVTIADTLQEEIKKLETDKADLEKERKRVSTDLNKCIAVDNKFVSDINNKENELAETKEKQVKRAKNDIEEKIQRLEVKMAATNDSLKQLIEKNGARYQVAKEAIENAQAKKYFESIKQDIEKICEQLGMEVSYEPNGLQPKTQPVEENQVEKTPVAEKEETVEAPKERRLFGFAPENYKTIKVLSRAIEVIKNTAKIVRHPIAAIEGTMKYVNDELPKNMGVGDYVDLSLNARKKADELKEQSLEEMRQEETTQEVEPIRLSESVEPTNVSEEEKEPVENKEEPETTEPALEEIAPITLVPTASDISQLAHSIVDEAQEKREKEEEQTTLEKGVQLLEQGFNTINKVVFENAGVPIKNAKMKTELVNVLAQHEIVTKMRQFVDSMEQTVVQPEEVEETQGKSL